MSDQEKFRYLSSLHNDELESVDALFQTEHDLSETRLDRIQNLYDSNVSLEMIEIALNVLDMHERK